MLLFFFFFSSRRRHTRFDCDWSSDVCSSDLPRTADSLAPASPSRPSPARHRPSCPGWRSEEHTSELQSQSNLVCRLLLEKKKRCASTPGDRIHATEALPDTLASYMLHVIDHH